MAPFHVPSGLFFDLINPQTLTDELTGKMNGPAEASENLQKLLWPPTGGGEQLGGGPDVSHIISL